MARSILCSVGIVRQQMSEFADACPGVAYSQCHPMKRYIKARARALLRPHLHSPQSVSIRAPLRAADARRSVKNILQWNCYLPIDCVRTMVGMGWDYTT
jgi:hypothetical protein